MSEDIVCKLLSTVIPSLALRPVKINSLPSSVVLVSVKSEPNEFTLNSLGSDFTLTNTTDDGREFIFTGLSASEGITVNNSLQTISSDTGLYRLSYFNKNWFRFLPGLNELHITSAISFVEFTYSFARAVGS